MNKLVLTGFFAVLLILLTNTLVAYRNLRGLESDMRLWLGLGLPTAVAFLAASIVFVLLDRNLAERSRAGEVKARLAAIVSSAQDAIISKDLHGRITSWNSGAENLFGYKAAEAIGQNVSLIIPADRLAEESHVIERLRRGERIELETERRDKQGRRIPISATISPVLDNAGQVVGASNIARDITGRKDTEEALRRAQDELERRVEQRTAELQAANKELEAFSYTVSHDLRAPLRAIDGFSRIVLDDYAAAVPADGQELLRDIRTNTQQMGRLLDDLLAFSRLSRQPLKRQPIDMNLLVRQALDVVRAQSDGSHVELRTEGLPPCTGDPALLKQVWFNLLSNALKYSSKRSSAVIEIGHISDSDEPTYFVKDNGVGFDMKYAHKLFGVFQRLHKAEEYEGTGVGLAIVQRIVHRHGGRVWAVSQPSQGATFYFTLSGEEDEDGGSSD